MPKVKEGAREEGTVFHHMNIINTTETKLIA